MTWTYSGNPADSDLDEVRFLIGDTDEGKKQLQNEEINYLLAEYTDPLAAAFVAVETLIAQYSRYTDQKTGDIDIKYSQRIANLQGLLATLKAKMARLAVPYAGGISVADKEIDQEDDDRVDPQFTVGIMDNLG